MTDLGLRFVRRPGPGGRAANLAAFGATAVVALLVTFLIAGSLGLSQRSERIGWRSGDKADPATAIGTMKLDDDQRVDGHRLTVLELATLKPNELAPPPGLDHTPKAGEVFVSPEVAKRWSSLSKEYGVDKPTGVISDKGLSSPEEFIVIRGVETIPADEHPQYVSSWNEDVMDSRMLGLLIAVAFGIILVLFPILSLVGQAAERLGDPAVGECEHEQRQGDGTDGGEQIVALLRRRVVPEPVGPGRDDAGHGVLRTAHLRGGRVGRRIEHRPDLRREPVIGR